MDPEMDAKRAERIHVKLSFVRAYLPFCCARPPVLHEPSRRKKNIILIILIISSHLGNVCVWRSWSFLSRGLQAWPLHHRLLRKTSSCQSNTGSDTPPRRESGACVKLHSGKNGFWPLCTTNLCENAHDLCYIAFKLPMLNHLACHWRECSKAALRCIMNELTLENSECRALYKRTMHISERKDFLFLLTCLAIRLQLLRDDMFSLYRGSFNVWTSCLCSFERGFCSTWAVLSGFCFSHLFLSCVIVVDFSFDLSCRPFSLNARSTTLNHVPSTCTACFEEGLFCEI